MASRMHTPLDWCSRVRLYKACKGCVWDPNAETSIKRTSKRVGQGVRGAIGQCVER